MVEKIEKNEKEAMRILYVLIALFIGAAILLAVLKGNYEVAQVGKASTSIVAPQYSEASPFGSSDSAFWARSRSRIQHHQDSSTVSIK